MAGADRGRRGQTVVRAGSPDVGRPGVRSPHNGPTGRSAALQPSPSRSIITATAPRPAPGGLMSTTTRVMHRGAIAAVAALSLVASSGTPVRSQASPGWTPDLSMKVKRVSSVEPSPDGQRVAFVVGEALMDGERSEWLSQIHVANADGSGAFQLTRGDKVRLVAQVVARRAVARVPVVAKRQSQRLAHRHGRRRSGDDDHLTRRAACRRSTGRRTARPLPFS